MSRDSAARVRSLRLRANNLAERLPAGSFAEAAFAGLQDSAPRAALLSLYARVDQVGPDDWEHSTLAQTWAPRGAVFVVPRDDLTVFARGIVPRNPDESRPLEKAASELRRIVEGAGPLVPAKLAERLGGTANAVSIRLAVGVAGLPIRWDARTTTILPPLPIEKDDEDARLELGRRYLRSLGPADPKGFTKWAAVSLDDAVETFAVLRAGDELAEVSGDDSDDERFVLATDLEALTSAKPVRSVRLLPFGGDPVLQPGDQTIGVIRATHGKSRLVLGDEAFELPRWAVGGAVLLDENLVASWGRQQGKLQIMPFRPLTDSVRRRIEAEAGSIQIPGVDSISINWRDPERS